MRTRDNKILRDYLYLVKADAARWALLKIRRLVRTFLEECLSQNAMGQSRSRETRER